MQVHHAGHSRQSEGAVAASRGNTALPAAFSQAIGCNQEHARRTLQSLLTEDKVSRCKLTPTGGRPLYACAELDFPYIPDTGAQHLRCY